MWARGFLVGAVCAVAVAGHAHALSMERAAALANEHWGGNPPCEQIEYIPWPQAPSMGHAYARDGECAIWISEQVLAIGGTLMCRVMVHEAGHIWGHAHSPDPHDVMHNPIPYPAPRAAVPQVCLRERDAHLRPWRSTRTVLRRVSRRCARLKAAVRVRPRQVLRRARLVQCRRIKRQAERASGRAWFRVDPEWIAAA
jgi:hypothetical protein